MKERAGKGELGLGSAVVLRFREGEGKGKGTSFRFTEMEGVGLWWRCRSPSSGFVIAAEEREREGLRE